MHIGNHRQSALNAPTAITLTVLVALFSLPCRADDVQERLDRMERIIQQQQAAIEAQQKQLAVQQELIRKMQGTQNLSTHERTADMASEKSVPGQDTETTGSTAPVAEQVASGQSGQQGAVAELARREEAGTAEREVDSEATLYDPSSTVYDPDFPGAWHLPGTTAAMKIGGYVNLALVNSFDPLESSDRFIVGSIPAEGVQVPGAQAGTTVTASQTRINTEVREQTTRGDLRAFVEGDFLGEGDTFRLRHAYGQFGSFLAGKTWSTFANLDALPEEVDFEGINGAVLQRQSQLRYFPKLGQDFSLVMSIEDPTTDVQNGTGEKGHGDLVLSVDRLPLGDLGAWNYKVSAIFRDLEGTYSLTGEAASADPLQSADTTGWGITTSGRKSFSRFGGNDFLLWQFTYGEGIGRYLNDLGTVGGGDAVFDDAGRLHALPVFAGFLSYRHTWARRPWFLREWRGLLRSNFTVSWVDVDNFEFQQDDAYDSTLRVSANVLYFPTQNVSLGAELLWGERTNKDDSKGSASQLQVSARYNF